MPYFGAARRCALLGGILLTVGGAPLVHASHVGEDLTVDQQTVTVTNQLLAAMRQLQAAPPQARAARIAELTRVAALRKAHLLALMERDPKLAGMRLLPEGLRDNLPAEARQHVESSVRSSGIVFASISDDFSRGQSKHQVFLQSADGTRLQLHLANAANAAARERALLALSGKQVSLQATRIDGHLLVNDAGQIQAAGGTTTAAATTTASSSSTIQGNKKTLVIMANFSDATLSCTPADVANRVFGTTGSTVNNDYVESSRSLVTFSGQVAGPFTIPYSASGTCDYTAWGAAAEAAAKAAGIDPSLFQHVNYVTPPNSTCGWNGLGYMPGSRTWVQSCGSTGVYAHELGHNLGFHHGSTPTAEYGDGSDPMGAARLVRFNGANQTMAGWMPAGTVLDVYNGGSYTVAALELTGSATPQVLRLFKPDTNEYYYVTLRQAIGVDTGLPTAYQNTLSIHRAAGTLPTHTYLMQNLAVGQSFTDATNGIQITHQGLSGNTSTVGVTLTGATCARSAPQVSFSPASQTGAPGSALTYNVTVSNLNSSACGTSTFAVSQAVPGGFTGSLAASSLSIAAGGSASTSVQVTSSTAALDGTYTFDVSAMDSAAGTASTSHGSYVLYRDTTAPTLAITSPANGAVLSGRSASLSASASDASGIQVVEFYVDGTLLVRDTGTPYTANWNLRKVPAGAHTIKARAIDKAGNATEQSISVTVN